MSQNSVKAILQDRRGFMWFGTQDGINIYDGYNFRVFKPIAGDSTSLSGNWVYTLIEDRRGWVWAGTYQGGLSCYRPEESRFYRYTHDKNDPQTISHNEVRCLLEDTGGQIWIGSFGGGLDRLDPLTGRMEHFRHDENDPGSLSNDFVTSLYLDTKGWIWIGTHGGGLERWDPAISAFHHTRKREGDPTTLTSDYILCIKEGSNDELYVGTSDGLNRLDKSRRVVKQFWHDPEKPHSLSDHAVTDLLFDHDGVLWVGTEQGGVNRYNPKLDQFDHYKNNPVVQTSLSSNIVLSMYEDRSGGLWIGTNGGGVSRYDHSRNRFNLFRAIPNNPKTLSQSDIRAIHIDDDNVLWVGTDLGGLNRIDRAHGTYMHYHHDPDDPTSISSDRIRAIYRTRDGALWIGTRDGGLNIMNEAKGTFTRFDGGGELKDDWVRVIFEDVDGHVFIGTGSSGLDVINRETGEISHIRRNTGDPTTMNRNIITYIYYDSHKSVWIGTRGAGLSRHDSENAGVEAFRHDPDDPRSLSHDVVMCVQEDLEGNVWVGTPGGLNLFNSDTKDFTHYFVRDGLPNDVIYGILPDKNGNLWISTNNGISCFNPEKGTFRNYDANDGLQSNEFNQTAFCSSRDGELFFGGLQGLNSFYPEQIEENSYIPPVEITAVHAFDRDMPFNSALPGIQTITIPYDKNLIAFEFAALNFTNPLKNEYAYRLEGFDSDWVFSGNRRFVSYTNLNPGRYTFHVLGSNNDGVWNEEGAKLNVIVTPPWWRTWWFALAVLLGIAGLFVGFNLLQVMTMRRANRLLEIKVQERTAELEQALKQLHASREMQLESERMRTAQQMAASVAHEFNNPLAIISAVYDLYEQQMAEDLPPEMVAQLERIPKTIQRMKSLVRRLLNITEVREADYAAGMKILRLGSQEPSGEESPRKPVKPLEGANSGSSSPE